jgi:hypothetical protein
MHAILVGGVWVETWVTLDGVLVVKGGRDTWGREGVEEEILNSFLTN